jgi:hypothetical protein
MVLTRETTCEYLAKIVIIDGVHGVHLHRSLLPEPLLSAARSDDPSSISRGRKAASLNAVPERTSRASLSCPRTGAAAASVAGLKLGREPGRSPRCARLARPGREPGDPYGLHVVEAT